MANLKVFNPTLETAKQWIAELMQTMGADEATACQALRVTLQALRDQLSVAEIADFSAQLPTLLRGVFFEGWNPKKIPLSHRDRPDFISRISGGFSDKADHEIEKMIRGVFLFLDRRVSPGEIDDIVNSLPHDIRKLWPTYLGEQRLG